jgi:hypothetical protein
MSDQRFHGFAGTAFYRTGNCIYLAKGKLFVLPDNLFYAKYEG